MIGRLRRVRDIALLIRDLPEILGLQLELQAEEQRAREAFDRRLAAIAQDIKELGQELADLDAITRELYLGPPAPPPPTPNIGLPETRGGRDAS